MKSPAPILMIGLDASEVTLIEKFCAEGKLPAIQSLRERGCFGSLEAKATIFAGGVWPTFYTAQDVPDHGVYHNKLWRHEHMRCEVVNEQWLLAKPFWQTLDEAGFKIAAIDVPMTMSIPPLKNGIQLSGWGTHDLIVKGATPTHLWKRFEKEFGQPLMPSELFGPQNVKTLLRLREVLLESTQQVAALSEKLLERERWDLFLVVFGATHRGGHYLWDLSQIDQDSLAPEQRRKLENALLDIYQASDRAVARLVAKAPAETQIMVFAVHGMGPNMGWSDRCQEILAKIQHGSAAGPAKSGLLYQIKQLIPWELARQVTTRLPQPVLNRLVSLWSANMFDWKTTRYFGLPMDHAGYFRINLQGREPEGVVIPGPEYEAVCRELEEALRSFRDIETGQSIVDRVYRLDDLAPAGAACRDVLPDLVVTWRGVSAIQSRGLISEKFGEIRWETGKLPSGRAGNHWANGWFVAAGQGITPASRVEGHRTIDLVPTVFNWLGAGPDETFQGEPIPALSRAAHHSSQIADNRSDQPRQFDIKVA